MHDLVGVVLPLKRSGDTSFQEMSPIYVGDLRQVSQVIKIYAGEHKHAPPGQSAGSANLGINQGLFCCRKQLAGCLQPGSRV